MRDQQARNGKFVCYVLIRCHARIRIPPGMPGGRHNRDVGQVFETLQSGLGRWNGIIAFVVTGSRPKSIGAPAQEHLQLPVGIGELRISERAKNREVTNRGGKAQQLREASLLGQAARLRHHDPGDGRTVRKLSDGVAGVKDEWNGKLIRTGAQFLSEELGKRSR